MKIVFLFIIISSLVHASSIVPNRIVTPSLDLYSVSNRVLDDGSVETRVTTYSKHGEFRKNGAKTILSKDTYLAFRKLSDPVMEMIPDERMSIDVNYRRGTAFSIGENLVLTNHHVLDRTFSNSTECSDFRLTDHEGEIFDCRKVHYCNKELDVCLIEMSPIIRKKRACTFCSGVKYEVLMAKGNSLKLKMNYHPSHEDSQKETFTAIGNSAGLGIHLSQGVGALITRNRTYFYAPITNGNSGGPLLNKAGLVIGVVKQQSDILIHSDPNQAFNVAAPIDLVISQIREALRDNPETLIKFNQSVIE